MKIQNKVFLLLVVVLVVSVLSTVLVSTLLNRPLCEEYKRRAVEAEYTRVVSAIARTMRCSTEEEFKRKEDHQCDPSEIEQDAGLVDEKGNVIR
jgi:hypothetical protein